MQLKEFIPPIVYHAVSKWRTPAYGWSGDYSSWTEAMRDSAGYNSESIVLKVKDALQKVVNGEAAYERDSITFSSHNYEWPLVAGLLWSAAQNRGELSVLDFGGSLGSTYFQNREFYKGLTAVKWGIVEQELFVTYGEKYFAEENLRFFRSIAECVKIQNPRLFLFSSVLQYMEEPYLVLQQAFEYKPEFIIIDKMAFLKGDRDRLTVQRTDPAIYEGSYPCWLLSRDRFMDSFSARYRCISGFSSNLSIHVNREVLPYEGFLFRRIEP